MKNSAFRKTAIAAAVAGTLAVSAPAEASVIYKFVWYGAMTMLTDTGGPQRNTPSDYAAGYYANGDGANTIGSPFYPGNVGPDATPGPNGSMHTSHGWTGYRTPISGSLDFDITNGGGVATINYFYFFGDTAGSGNGTQTLRTLGLAFARLENTNTFIGTYNYVWNGESTNVSIAWDASGFLDAITNYGMQPGSVLTGNQLTNPSGGPYTVNGVLPASDGVEFAGGKTPLYLPLGPAPIATMSLNALGCEDQFMATQIDLYTIIPTGNTANCDLTQDDGIGGSPMVSGSFQNQNMNLDLYSMHLESIYSSPVPLPAAAWLFGSGLLGLIGIARRRKNNEETSSG